MTGIAASFTVSGLHGWLILTGFILAAVAAVIAWVAVPKAAWATCIAAAVALFLLAQLITG